MPIEGPFEYIASMTESLNVVDSEQCQMQVYR